MPHSQGCAGDGVRTSRGVKSLTLLQDDGTRWHNCAARLERLDGGSNRIVASFQPSAVNLSVHSPLIEHSLPCQGDAGDV